MTRVFVGMGGNLGDTCALFEKVLHRMRRDKTVSNLRVSSFYLTSPVSPIPQPDYVNAVCSFDTTLDILPLFATLEAIEKEFGKKKKPKEAPRILDLDLLFYGNTRYCDANVQVPHPRFHERQFVLVPLLELLEME